MRFSKRGYTKRMQFYLYIVLERSFYQYYIYKEIIQLCYISIIYIEYKFDHDMFELMLYITYII